jgi:hypothetical protein
MPPTTRNKSKAAASQEKEDESESESEPEPEPEKKKKKKNPPPVAEQQKDPPAVAELEIEWRYSPAKMYLKKCFVDGLIDIDYSGKDSSGKSKGGPKNVWDTHCKDHPTFAGMEYKPHFSSRLRGVRDDYVKKRGRAADDKEAYDNFRRICPVKTHNHRGEPRWEGSRAQELLRLDMDEGVHDVFLPARFQQKRIEYQDYRLQTFRDHINQETRLRKYNNWLLKKEIEDEEKLKEKGRKKAKETARKKKKKGAGDLAVVEEEEKGDGV